ncbi:MAG: DUF4760 domain-containing protein [Lachnospiraceae bacterium]|nr:DUF4760 domain-containing protein [Lachnospiraceae bacterium]
MTIEVASTIAACVSAICAAIALIISAHNERHSRLNELRWATIEAFHTVQRETLDNLLPIDKSNAQTIISEMEDNEKCRKAYAGYIVLLARIECLSVGIYKKVYDKELLYDLGGQHLISVYEQVEIIIKNERENVNQTKAFAYFEKLISEFKTR